MSPPDEALAHLLAALKPGDQPLGPFRRHVEEGDGHPLRPDVTRACLEAFATAAAGGRPYLIPTSEMIHGAAVTEAVVQSAASGQVVTVA